jgi:hypothetical protein
MSMTEAPFSYTLKTPKLSNLLTVRGGSAEDFKANLEQLPAKGILTLIGQIESTLAGQPNPTQAVSGGRPVSQAQQSAPPATAAGQSGQLQGGTQELPSGFGTPKCAECGGETRFAQEGVSKKSGKAYKRYACTANQLHKSTFAV